MYVYTYVEPPHSEKRSEADKQSAPNGYILEDKPRGREPCTARTKIRTGQNARFLWQVWQANQAQGVIFFPGSSVIFHVYQDIWDARGNT